MISVPIELTSDLKKIIEWHLRSYMPERFSDTRLKRVLTRFPETNEGNDVFPIEDHEICYIYDCVSDAMNNISECGVDKESVSQIFDWIWPEYNKIRK